MPFIRDAINIELYAVEVDIELIFQNEFKYIEYMKKSFLGSYLLPARFQYAQYYEKHLFIIVSFLP